MNILLIARDTQLNRLVRKETNSAWGHCGVVIDDIVYNFDFKSKSKTPLSFIISNPSISRATLFYADMLDREDESEELYKKLFTTAAYDVRALFNLRGRGPDGRDLDNIQRSPEMYTCSSLIGKVFSEISEHPQRGVHWSQATPIDYSNLELRTEYN